MPRKAKGLVAAGLKFLPVGRHADGGGLYAVVNLPGRIGWAFRYMRAGRAREMGLGTLATVTLAEARERAREAARLLAADVDPLEHRAAEEAARAAEEAARAAKSVTFGAAAEAYIATHKATWHSEKTVAAWRNTLLNHAAPVLGDVPVGTVTREHVLRVLEPMWQDLHVTARKTRVRIAAVLDYATERGWRTDPVNPGRGKLPVALGGRPVAKAERHYAALPWTEAAAFMVALRQRDALAARMLELVILTACRSSEARLATWAEVDLEAAVWTIPAAHTKTRKAPHRVPLSREAVALLRGLLPLRDADPKAADPLIFPGRGGRPLSLMAMEALLDRMNANPRSKPVWRDPDGRAAVPHGWRSTFRTWAGETTPHAREVVEAAMAHRVGDAVERAYARGDAFTKRARLMQDWADFLSRQVPAVAELSAARAAKVAG